MPKVKSDKKENRDTFICKECEQNIIPNIDYSIICDDFIWIYLFLDIEISWSDLSNSCDWMESYLRRLLELFPLVRSYQSIDKIGKDSFIHECYFITHLVFAFSNYGQHPLSREIFAEEFIFILENLPILVSIDEVDSVE